MAKTSRKSRPADAGRKLGDAAPAFAPPLTVSLPDMLIAGSDDAFRQTVYLMGQVLARLASCREAFGRAIDLSGSQFVVLIGVAYRQGAAGVKISALANYVQLASTHVTTEVGALHRRGLLNKRASSEDRRIVLVSLTEAGEEAVRSIAPFLVRVNDLLFKGLARDELETLHAIFDRLSLNGELAMAELRRTEREGSAERVATLVRPSSAGRRRAPDGVRGAETAPVRPTARSRRSAAREPS